MCPCFRLAVLYSVFSIEKINTSNLLEIRSNSFNLYSNPISFKYFKLGVIFKVRVTLKVTLTLKITPNLTESPHFTGISNCFLPFHKKNLRFHKKKDDVRHLFH
jgi:hypothetical protein